MACDVDASTLRRSLVLGGLAPAELARLAAAMRRRTFRRGDVILRQGEPGDTLHVVLAGHVKVVVTYPGGEEPVLSLLGPGDLFGEMALLDGGPRSATVIAVEPVETATLRRADLLALLRRSPPAVEAVLAALTRIARRASEQVTDLMVLDLPGRLAKKLLELGATHGHSVEGAVTIEVLLSQEELAAMVGGTRATVNKLLGVYVAQGAIARQGRRIAILKPELLRRRITA